MSTNQHEKFIKRCIELAQEALDAGDNPFGAVVVKDNRIIAMRNAKKALGTPDLSGCTLYSNCEPCPMCSFMAREQKLEAVVFALRAPHMGGYSRWDILQDQGLARYEPVYTFPPNVVTGVL